MGMLETLKAEQAKRQSGSQLEQLKAEKARRSEAISGKPNIIEEMHEDISVADRAIVKNLSQSPEKSAAYLKRTNPQLDTRVWDGRVLVKGKNETNWKTLDPDADGFDGFAELGRDALDIGYDVASGIGEGAAMIGAGLTTGGLGAVAGGAAAGAASEAARQGLGSAFGIDQDIDAGDVAMTGALSGLVPLVPGALVKAGKTAIGGAKGAAKFLGGIDDKAIAGMTREGEQTLRQLEKESILPTVEKLSSKIGRKISDVEARNADRILKVKESLNIADDVELKEVLTREIQAEKLGNNDFGKIESLKTMINDISETKEVREQISKIGVDDAQAVRQGAFPESMSIDTLESTGPEINKKLQSTLAELRSEYEQLGAVGEDVNLNSLRDLYANKTAFLRRDGATPGELGLADALDKDLAEKLSMKKTVTDPSGIFGPKTSIVQRGETAEFADAARIKNVFAQAYKNTRKVSGDIDQVNLADNMSKMHQQAERVINEEMQKASQGLKGELDPRYVSINNAIKEAGTMFDTPAKVNATLKRAMRKGDAGKIEMARIKRIDDIAGTDYLKTVQATIEAEAKTNKGLSQAKQLLKSNALAEDVAEKGMTKKDKLYRKIRSGFTDSKGKADTTKTVKSLNDYANANNPELSKTINDLSENYGEGVAREFKETVDDIGLAAIFGDSEKTLIKNIEGEQASNTARGIAQGLAWQTPLGAGGAQVGGAIGKAIGAQVPIRKALRATLPAYFEKKAALKGLSDSAKKELEKKFMNTILRRRDAIRELSKKLATDKDRG